MHYVPVHCSIASTAFACNDGTGAHDAEGMVHHRDVDGLGRERALASPRGVTESAGTARDAYRLARLPLATYGERTLPLGSMSRTVSGPFLSSSPCLMHSSGRRAPTSSLTTPGSGQNGAVELASAEQVRDVFLIPTSSVHSGSTRGRAAPLAWDRAAVTSSGLFCHRRYRSRHLQRLEDGARGKCSEALARRGRESSGIRCRRSSSQAATDGGGRRARAT